MKFKFCGNIDCPEWLIAEITFLTKISTIKLRIICNNMVNCIISNGKNLNDIKKSIEDLKFSEDEAVIIISVLEFILKTSTKFEVDDFVLNQELQQLGLPNENADSISKVYKNTRENLKKKLKEDIFGFSKVISVDYKINYILANKYSGFEVSKSDDFDFKNNTEKNAKLFINNLETKVNLKLNLDSNEVCQMTLNKETLGKLINDLERASEKIKKLKSE